MQPIFPIASAEATSPQVALQSNQLGTQQAVAVPVFPQVWDDNEPSNMADWTEDPASTPMQALSDVTKRQGEEDPLNQPPLKERAKLPLPTAAKERALIPQRGPWVDEKDDVPGAPALFH